MRRKESILLLASALGAALVSILASRVVVARTKTEQAERQLSVGPTLEDFSAERRNREFGLRLLVEEGRWEAAAEQARALLAFDPASGLAREVLERAQAEKRAAEGLAAALERLREGGEEEALRALYAIPADTESGRRARIEAEPLVERLSERARGDCLGLARAGSYERALERCRLHLDLACGRGAEPALLERLRWLERRLRVQAGETWSCPHGGKAEVDSGVEAILRAWERGESGDRAALRMERLAAQGIEEAERYVEALRRAEAWLRDGFAALVAGDLEKARQALARADGAERELMGQGRSLRFREAAQRFARLALERGLELEAKRRYRDAQRVLGWGVELEPANTELLRALWRLEDEGASAAP